MDYLRQFAEVDKDKDGLISRRDLFKYALSIGENVSMVDTWFKLFDAGDTGIITIEDLSRTLGVPPPKYYKQQMFSRNNDLQKSMPDLNMNDEIDTTATRMQKWKSMDHALKNDDMGVLQYKVTQLVNDGLRGSNMEESILASQIGRAMEKQYGKNWHVHVSRYNIGCAFEHLPEQLVQLKLSGYFVVAYRTRCNAL